MSDIKELVGLTFESVVNFNNEEIIFKTIDGKTFKMFHNQNCCESVSIEDICGDLNDLVGVPILKAEESTNSESHPEDKKIEYHPDSFTWTFYHISTIKGSVTIRWYGISNGYYSERVSFEKD